MGSLRRDLGLFEATTIIVGSMIGSGIFLGPELIARLVPQGGLMLVVWIAAGVLIFTGALCFAELGAMFPKSGGHYVYVREAYGNLPAFLNGWSLFWVSKTASIAALAAGFSLAVNDFFPAWPGWAFTALSVGVIILFSGINYVGVRHGGTVQNVATTVKVAALLGLGVMGLLWSLGGGTVTSPGAALVDAAPAATAGFAAFGLALVPALWAYDGWANASQVAEEVKEPERNLPRALIVGTLLVLGVYVVVVLIYLATLGVDGIASSSFAAGDAAEAIAGPWGRGLMTAAVIISILGTLNAVTLSGPRIYYAMARDRLFFRKVEGVHAKYATPAFSILIQAAWSIALVLLFNFEVLLNYVIVVSWVFYGLSGLALVSLRRKRPELARPFKVPLYPWVPLVFVALSAAFVVNALVEAPKDALMGALLLGSGLPFYVYWNHRKAWDRWVAREPGPAPVPVDGLSDAELALLAYVEGRGRGAFDASGAGRVIGEPDVRRVMELVTGLAAKDHVRVGYHDGMLRVTRAAAP